MVGGSITRSTEDPTSVHDCRGIEKFLELDFRAPGQLTANEYNSYKTLNALIEDEVEVRWRLN